MRFSSVAIQHLEAKFLGKGPEAWISNMLEGNNILNTLLNPQRLFMTVCIS